MPAARNLLRRIPRESCRRQERSGAQATSPGQRRTDAVAPSLERAAPVIAPKMASDQPAPGGANPGGSKEKLFQPDGKGESMVDSPKPSENPEGMKPDAMEGEKPGMPASDANKAASASAAMPDDSAMPSGDPRRQSGRRQGVECCPPGAR